jgi:hypothetical protein
MEYLYLDCDSEHSAPSRPDPIDHNIRISCVSLITPIIVVRLLDDFPLLLDCCHHSEGGPSGGADGGGPWQVASQTVADDDCTLIAL